MEVIKCKWLRRFVEKRNSPLAIWGRKGKQRKGGKTKKEKREPCWKMR